MIDGDSSYTGDYIPAYTDLFGKEIPMKKKSATIKEDQGVRQLEISPGDSMCGYISLREDRMYLNHVRNIRAALYQMDDDAEEQKLLRERLVKLLKDKKDDKFARFSSQSSCLKAIIEVDEDDPKR